MEPDSGPDGGPAPTRLQQFVGRWRLSRRIEDRARGEVGRLDGVAEFSATPDGLLYEERGRLAYAGTEMEAGRCYRWREAASGLIAVAFEDGRPFHDFHLGSGANALHHCPPDTYRVAYDFSAWPRWRAVWEVSGPSKDYVSVTEYAPD